MKDQKTTPKTAAKETIAKAKDAEAEADLDEALEETFPASDPLPTGGFTGAPKGHVSANVDKSGKGGKS